MVVRVAVLAALSGIFFYLFCNQASGAFSSDLEAHIARALAEGKSTYSFVQAILGFSYVNFGYAGVALFLTCIEVLILIASERFMRALLPDVRPGAVFALALVVNFVGAVYLPVISPHFSKGVSIANVWHNSTYLGMKLFSVLTMWSYLRFVGLLDSRNKVLDWVVFTATVVMGAAVKPSFAIVFGPAVVVFCVGALMYEGAGSLKRSLALSVPFFAIVAIMLYQYTILFTEVKSSGIGFGLAVVWRHSHPFFPLAMLQSYAFPLIVLIACRKEVKSDANYRMALLMFVFALCIFLFVNETGHRMYHGNFGWSLKIALYYLFLVSVVVFVRTHGRKFPFLMKQGPASSNAAAGDGKLLQGKPDSQGDVAGGQPIPSLGTAARPAFWPEICATVVLGAHLLTGIVYFIRLLMGRGF